MYKVILSQKDISIYLPKLVKLIKKSIGNSVTTTKVYELIADTLGYQSYASLKREHVTQLPFDLTIDKEQTIQSILQLGLISESEHQSKIIKLLNNMDWALALNALYLDNEHIIKWNNLHIAMFNPKGSDLLELMNQLKQTYAKLNTSEHITLNFFNLKQDQSYTTDINMNQNKIQILQEYISHNYIPAQKEQWVGVLCAESAELLQQLVYKLLLNWLKPYTNSQFNDCLKQMTHTAKHYLMQGERKFTLERKQSIENNSVHWLFRLSPNCSEYEYVLGMNDTYAERKVSHAFTYYHQHTGFIQKLFTASHYLPKLSHVDNYLTPSLTYLNRQFNQQSEIHQHTQSPLLSMHFDNNEPLVVEDVLGHDTVMIGVSGSGKSIFLCELIIALRKNNKSIIMLDASSGFGRLNELLGGSNYGVYGTEVEGKPSICLDLIKYKHIYKEMNEFKNDVHYYLSQMIVQYEEYKTQIDNVLFEVSSTLELIERIPQLQLIADRGLHLESSDLIEVTEFTLIDIDDYYRAEEKACEFRLNLILMMVKQFKDSIVIIDEILYRLEPSNAEMISSISNQIVKVFQGVNEVNQTLFNTFDKLIMLTTSDRFKESMDYKQVFNDSKENIKPIVSESRVVNSVDKSVPFMVNYFHIYDKEKHQFQSAKFIGRMYQKSFFFWRNEKFYDINVVKEVLSRMNKANIKEIMLELDIKDL